MANPDPRAAPAVGSGTGGTTNPSILLNSVVALLLGAAITVLFHELAHWLAGAALGSQASLFAFGVTYDPELTGSRSAIAAAAGPVASLLLGSVMQVLQPFRFRGDFAHLLCIWVARTTLMEAATYLVITPWAGDPATIVAAMGWPAWVAWPAAAVGVAAMLGVAHQWAIHAVRLCGRDLTRLRCFSWYPWLIAIPVQIALVLGLLTFARMQLSPAEQVVVVMAGMAQTVFGPLSMVFASRLDELEEPLLVKGVPWLGVAGLLALTVWNFAISGGVRIG